MFLTGNSAAARIATQAHSARVWRHRARAAQTGLHLLLGNQIARVALRENSHQRSALRTATNAMLAILCQTQARFLG